MGGSEVVAKLVMAIESGQIDSGFGIGRGRSINGWEEIVDSNTLMYNKRTYHGESTWPGYINRTKCSTCHKPHHAKCFRTIRRQINMMQVGRVAAEIRRGTCLC